MYRKRNMHDQSLITAEHIFGKYLFFETVGKGHNHLQHELLHQIQIHTTLLNQAGNQLHQVQTSSHLYLQSLKYILLHAS